MVSYTNLVQCQKLLSKCMKARRQDSSGASGNCLPHVLPFRNSGVVIVVDWSTASDSHILYWSASSPSYSVSCWCIILGGHRWRLSAGALLCMWEILMGFLTASFGLFFCVCRAFEKWTSVWRTSSSLSAFQADEIKHLSYYVKNFIQVTIQCTCIKMLLGCSFNILLMCMLGGDSSCTWVPVTSVGDLMEF